MAAKSKAPRNEIRNQRVIAALIGSMTLGAAILLWLTGPAAASRSSNAMLIAQNAVAPRSATIELVTRVSETDLTAYDVVVRRDAAPAWNAHSADLRIAVVVPNGEPLRDQKLGLLRVLGEAQRQGLNLADISLDAGSDDRITAGLPRAAGDLRALLEQKGLIR